MKMNINYLTLLSRILLLGLLWWSLTDGEPGSWLVGVPVVLFAAFVSVRMLPAMSWSLSGIFLFSLFFLWHSLRGGIDVAQRALHPGMPISPAMHDFRFRLPAGPPRILMANVVNLLPGTLSAEVGEDCLKIHVLDDTGTFAAELRILEQQVASVLNIELFEEASGSC